MTDIHKLVPFQLVQVQWLVKSKVTIIYQVWHKATYMVHLERNIQLHKGGFPFFSTCEPGDFDYTFSVFLIFFFYKCKMRNNVFPM